MHTSFLGFLDKLFLALGAGNGDLSLALGDTHCLVTPGTLEISVVPILYPVQKPQIFPVLLIPLVGIAGQSPEDRPEHKAVGHQGQKQLCPGPGQEHLQNTRAQTHHQNRGVKLI